jgi:hypothetical protein
MAILNVLNPYVDGQTITSSNLNSLVTDSTFASEAVDDITTQIGGASGKSIVVRDNAIDRSKLKSELKGALEIIDSSAYVGGDKTGNTRGDSALDIQSYRGIETTVASGEFSIAIGSEAEASGNSSVSIGFGTTASDTNCVTIGRGGNSHGQNAVSIGSSNSVRNAPDGSTNPGTSGAVAVGRSNVVTGNDEETGKVLGIGHSNTVTGDISSAVGLDHVVSSDNAHAYGNSVTVSSQDSLELGLWQGTSRRGGIKLNFGGATSFTCLNTTVAPSDQPTAGNEGEEELGRSMFTIQRNGDVFTLYFNDAGTIKSLTLGTVT